MRMTPISPSTGEVQITSDRSKFVIHNYPVVYVIFGEIPMFLRLNIELASRRNPVVVISDAVLPRYFSFLNNGNEQTVTLIPMSDYSEGRNRFVRLYRHLSKDKSNNVAESRCFQRWFILHDFMDRNNITHVLFADGDSAIFTSAYTAWKMRNRCSAVINVDTQRSPFYWVAAGEASLWMLPAIADFCKFIESMYSKHVDIISLKFKSTQTNVVDMSLLWLWWVAHFDKPGWESGRPYLTANSHAYERRTDIEMRSISDISFNETKALLLPAVDSSLSLCNGLDVVNRTVFDHVMGWYTLGERFSFDLDGEGIPYAYGIAYRLGGKPESLDEHDIELLRNKKLYVNNIHYQGATKEHILYDICRVLSMTGHRVIFDPYVRKQCMSEFERHQREWTCAIHPRYDKLKLPPTCV